MSSGARASSSIPKKMQGTIQGIREIAGKHSDEDIYAMLRECGMDPNDAAQKLLYLDTFHEVKGKRDRKKENVSSKGPDHSKKTDGGQARVARVGHGIFSARSGSSDAKGKKNATIISENGAGNIVKGSVQKIPKTENDSASCALNASDEQVSERQVPQTSWGSNFVGRISFSDVIKSGSSLPPPSNSNHVKKPIVKPVSTSALGNQEAKSQQTGLELEGEACSPEPIIVTKPVDTSINNLKSTVNKAEEVVSNKPKVDNRHELSFSETASQPPQAASVTKGVALVPELKEAGSAVEISFIPLPETTVSILHETASKLIIPNHIQVPEEYKSGLTFGSFKGSLRNDGKFVEDYVNDMEGAPEISCSHASDETVQEPSTGTQDAEDTVFSSSPEHLMKNVSLVDGDETSEAVPKHTPPEPEGMLPHGRPEYSVHVDHNFGFMPPTPLQVNISELQGHDLSRLPKFLGESSMAAPISIDPVQAASQASGDQGTIPQSPQTVPILRQTFPANYFPYSHCFPPFVMPPTQQFITHGGYLQQPPANVYLASAAAAAAAGIKYPLPHYKPGFGAGAQTQIGVPAGYGSFGSPAFPFNIVPAVASVNTGPNEDAASQMKESNGHPLPQQNERPGGGIVGNGRDSPGVQTSPFYHQHNGQPVMFSPAHSSFGPFPGYFHPAHTFAAQQLAARPHQQSQIIGPAEGAGPMPPSGAYQQPQGAQINWDR